MPHRRTDIASALVLAARADKFGNCDNVTRDHD